MIDPPHDAPKDIGRNEFDEWCWRRGLSLRDVVAGLQSAADHLGGADGQARQRHVPSIETVRRIRLPFTDAGRRVPAEGLVELIQAFTGGEIVAGHFYPPALRGAPAEPTLIGAAE